MTDKEMIEEMKAREELEKRGYKKINCLSCNGTGRYINTRTYYPPPGSPCPECDGKGHWWKKPITESYSTCISLANGE